MTEQPTTAACSRCGHPSHELGKCQARYHVTYNAAEVGETCLCAIEAEARQQGGSAAEWKRKYEGMVKERDSQIYRKREARRILETRSAPPALDVDRLAAALHEYGGVCQSRYRRKTCSAPDHRIMAAALAAEYGRLQEQDR